MLYASAIGFVRMILIILLIYFGIRILTRLFAPLLAKFVVKKAEQRFGDQFGQFQKQRQQQPIKKEGEISIDKMPPKSKATNNDVGDYVDYEEID